MSTIERAYRQVAHPTSGEVINLDGPTDLLARARLELIEIKHDLDSLAGALDIEMTARLDKANKRSANVGGYSIATKAPDVVEYPTTELLPVLHDLVARGLLEADVIDRVAIPQPPPPPKVDRSQVRLLLNHTHSEVSEAIQRVGVKVPQRRTVTVKRVT